MHFYQSLDPFWRFIFDFLFVTVFLKGIMAHKVAAVAVQGISQMSKVEGSMLNGVMKKLSTIDIITRKVAIVEHYRHNHVHDGVEGCTEEKCSIFIDTAAEATGRAVAA